VTCGVLCSEYTGKLCDMSVILGCAGSRTNVLDLYSEGPHCEVWLQL